MGTCGSPKRTPNEANLLELVQKVPQSLEFPREAGLLSPLQGPGTRDRDQGPPKVSCTTAGREPAYLHMCPKCEAWKCKLWAVISDGSDILIIQLFKNQVSSQPLPVTASVALTSITALSSVYSVGEHSVR